MNAFDQYEVWFVTGAQLLYGGDAVVAVDAHSNEMVKGLNDSGRLPVKVVYKGTVNSSKEVTAAFKAANNDEKCIGVITWMHTFSPAKMWIHGLQELKKPLLHFHTQFNKEIPWETMDMDFMNLNQSAHGDREFGHIVTRMRKNRKVVVGHWQDEKAQKQIASWMRVAAAWADAQDMLIIRFLLSVLRSLYPIARGKTSLFLPQSAACSGDFAPFSIMQKAPLAPEKADQRGFF